MRNYQHVLTKSKTGKSVIFRINVEDRFGKQAFNFSSVTGWRSKLAINHLFFESKDWNDDVARNYVGINALKCARDRHEGLQFINIVRSLGSMEIHFWANKFMINQKTGKAWRAMYA